MDGKKEGFQSTCCHHLFVSAVDNVCHWLYPDRCEKRTLFCHTLWITGNCSVYWKSDRNHTYRISCYCAGSRIAHGGKYYWRLYASTTYSGMDIEPNNFRATSKNKCIYNHCSVGSWRINLGYCRYLSGYSTYRHV